MLQLESKLICFYCRHGNHHVCEFRPDRETCCCGHAQPLPRFVYITHGTAFENWGPETPDQRGIGQSETANIELAQRLAQRGWDVTCYAPIPEDCPREYKGVHWRTMEGIDFTQAGYWLVFRQPDLLDQFAAHHPHQFIGVVSQDENYATWNDDRCGKLDALFALCNSHQRSLEADNPALKGKVRVAANGIKMEMIRRVEAEIEEVNSGDGYIPPDTHSIPPQKITRDPHRIMWASSPDRGLLRLLQIFQRIREWVSDATLFIGYGFDNIDKLVALDPVKFAWMQRAKDEIMKAADQPGVHWLGRIPQPQLMKEWAKSGLIIYPTTFRETFGSAHCEAMAMGAIPVVSPVWALGEHSLGGSLIPGDPADPMIWSRFVSEAYAWMADARRAEFTRLHLMREARIAFNWERAVDLYEAHLLGYHANDRMMTSQFNFQLKQCLGAKSILNIGCADDPAKLKQMGAVNLDLRQEDPIFHRQTAADVFMDMRDLSGFGEFRFERLVYGDCLEHFIPEAVPAILREGMKHLAPGGRIVITVPEDHRPPGQQHAGADGTQEYHDGVSAVHLHPVTREMIDGWLAEAGLVAVERQEMDCHWYTNHGVAAMRREDGELE